MVAAVLIAVVVIGGVVALALGTSNNGNQKIVKFTSVPPLQQGAKIADGSIIGGVAWEPYVSSAVASGQAKVLVWSTDIWPNHACCVIVVNKDFAAANPDVVKAFLKADIEATEWINEARDPTSANHTLLLQMGADFSHVSTDVVADSLGHMSITYSLDQTFLGDLKNYTQEFIDLNQTSTAKLNAAGYSSVDDFVGKYATNQYLADVSNVTPSTGPLTDVRIGYLTGDLHQFARLVASNATVGGGTSLYAKYGINAIAANAGGYSNGPAEMDAFAANGVDIGYLGAPPAILKHLNSGTNTQIIAAANEGGSALIVSNSVNSFDDLNGKTVGDPGLGSIQHLLLQAMADKYGFKTQAA